MTARSVGETQVCVLGGVRLVVGGRQLTPRRGEEQLLLARLAVDAGRPVEALDLLDAAAEGLAPLRPASRVEDELRDVAAAVRRADPALCRLERTGTAWTLHLGAGVLDLDRFRGHRDAGLRALAAHDPDSAVDHLRTAAALFGRPALADLPGRWARRLRDALEVEALEAHVVLADLLTCGLVPADPAGAQAALARFFRPTFRLWEDLVRSRLDAGADDVLAAALRTAGPALGTRLQSEDGYDLWSLLRDARVRVEARAPAGSTGQPVAAGRDLEVRLFGRFAVRLDGRDVTPAEPADRAVLAALVLHRGTTVARPDLVAAGWPGIEVVDAAAVLRRTALTFSGLTSTVPPRAALHEDAAGYRLDLPDPCTDADRVEALLAVGSRLLTEGAARQAVEPLAEAADLCSRPALELLWGNGFAEHRDRLEALALTAAERLADALVDGVLTARGKQPDAALARLGALVARHPASLALRERLMTGHDLAGRPLDAVTAYETARADLGPGFAGRRAEAMTALHRDLNRTREQGRLSTVRFHVLDRPGLEVLGRPATLPGRDDRRALAVFLLRRGTVVPALEVVTAVRGGDTLDPQTSAARIVDSLLRAVALATQAPFGTPKRAEREARRSPLSVTADSGGWHAELPPGVLDLDRVADTARQGLAALHRGDAAAAADALRDVLRRTPAAPFPDLDGAWFAAERDRIARWRQDLVPLCVRAELTCGRPADAVADLERLAAAAPHDEALAADLVGALATVGRTADAHAAYDRCAAALHHSLGTAPGPALRMLLRRLDDAPGRPG